MARTHTRRYGAQLRRSYQEPLKHSITHTTKAPTVAALRTALDLDNNEYGTLYEAMESGLAAAGLLGTRLNTVSARQRLHAVSMDVYKAAIPRAKPSGGKELVQKALQTVAHKCNNNYVRRTPGHRAAARAQPLLAEPSRSHRPSIPEPYNLPNGRIVFVVRRPDVNRSACFRPVDITRGDRAATMWSMADLRFLEFKKLISQDIGYTEKEHIIWYTIDNGAVAIKNERQWKAALDDMVATGASRFEFTIGGHSPAVTPTRSTPATD